MTINKITDTPIMVNSYNSRGLVTNHFITKNCVRQADGTLWTIVADHVNKLFLMKSTDQGFTWDTVVEGVETELDLRNVAGLNADGIFAFIVIDERYRLLDVYMGWQDIVDDSFIDRSRYLLDDFTTAATSATVESDVYHAMFDVCHNHEQVFLTYVQDDGDLAVTRCSTRSTAVANPDVQAAGGTSFWNFLSTVVTKDGIVHILTGRGDAGDDEMEYWAYDSFDGSFTGPVTVQTLSGSGASIPRDVSLAIDGLGNLCGIWTDQINGTSTADLYYGTSIDSGTTWDVNQITITAGHAIYEDAITGDFVNRGNIIGGSQGGFVLSYVDDNASAVPKTYVRQLTTSDAGATYDLGDELEIAATQAGASDAVVGLKWFHPTDVKLLDISDPALLRYAYQVGEGNSLTMTDTKAVSFFQELGGESPFPTSLASEASSHTLDTADSVSLRVLVNIQAGPNSNIDFYAAGFTGDHTDRFMTAFERMGTHMRLLRHEPKADNFLNDRSSYDAATESSSLAVFTPVSYGFPAPNIEASGIEDWIERDTRKIYLPPNTHLARTYLVNTGGFLKRTVWLTEFDGNQYELSQVVPRFLSGQICYYDCNAYVVGPSRDPFARTILPSET